MSEHLNDWIRPFYPQLVDFKYVRLKDPKFSASVREAMDLIEPAVVQELLESGNWRHNLVGSWFAGIKRWNQFQDTIGTQLCTPGLPMHFRMPGYCLALANFADQASAYYLEDYVNRTRLEGGDVGWALGALHWVRKQLGTGIGPPFLRPAGSRKTRGSGATPGSDKSELCWRESFRNVMTHTVLMCGLSPRDPNRRIGHVSASSSSGVYRVRGSKNFSSISDALRRPPTL